ncbi:hypothetical protein [Streptomyces chryseus]|uniref:hypothetical protein n=1 Tax=Streptomyces chryseus TaxID=68186 RepID=UPI00110FD62E|nr:hypothetical protein [Streptomyces chryseus]GGX01892.1 hypothetical protein GCM10010353_16880 [Streptomyces chryseus]
MLDVLGDYPEAVEADLAHHYPGYGPGGPVAAFWRGEITLRWLRVMVQGLPPDGAMARAMAGHHWQHIDWAAAETRDMVERLFVAFCNANRDPKSAAVPYPERTWRPGDPMPEPADEDAKREQSRAAYEHIVSQVKRE